MRIPEKRFTRNLAIDLLEFMFTVPYQGTRIKEVWQTPSGREHRLSTFVDRRIGTGLFINWEPIQPGIARAGDDAQFNFDPRNRVAWPGEGCVWLAVWVFQHSFSRTDSAKVNRVISVFKELVRIAKPEFAVVDYWAENMVKRKGKDPRRFAWGAMYYDEAHVKAIGKDRLASCTAIIKEEWPDGGFWVQTWANPFVVAKELTQEMEKELGLKELFGDSGASGRADAVIKNVAGKRKSRA